MRSIVVGVDGSESSLKALQFALAEARLRGADVTAVNAWNLPPFAYGGVGWSTPVRLDEYAQAAEAQLKRSLTQAGVCNSGVTVTEFVGQGLPAEILCAAAKDADLLVVGSRGLGGFGGLVLGSVGQQCAAHAPCPVVIIPHVRH